MEMKHKEMNTWEGKEDTYCHGGRPLVGFPSVLAFNPNVHGLAIWYGSRRTQTLNWAPRPCQVSRGGQLEYGLAWGQVT